jgi:hypothetical protein
MERPQVGWIQQSLTAESEMEDMFEALHNAN